jgi:sigma-E factor negative regulatory protein RseC
MIEQQGRVLSARPTADGRSVRLRVELPRRSACGGCAQSAGCGTAALAGLFSEKSQHVELELEMAERWKTSVAPEPWRAGDAIWLGIDPRALLGAAVLAYLMPVILMLVGALLGAAWGTEVASVLLAGIGLLAGLGLGRRWLHGRVISLDNCLTGRAATADSVEFTTATMTGD